MLKTENKHIVYLALGSNIGDPEANLLCALRSIKQSIGELDICSSFYATEPFGFDSENQFLNAVCRVSSTHTPNEILSRILTIEKEMGRTLKSVDGCYADRIIDIDILMYDNLVLNESALIIPHPKMHERLFVLDPLAEIAPGLMHPVFHKSIAELKSDLAGQ